MFNTFKLINLQFMILIKRFKLLSHKVGLGKIKVLHFKYYVVLKIVKYCCDVFFFFISIIS